MEGSVSSSEAERQKFVQRSVSRKFWPSVDTISLTGVQEKSRAMHGFVFGNVLYESFSAQHWFSKRFFMLLWCLPR